ncbi:MAG: ABC transporter permease [Spirochaetales bacterium]|nr:ABC transporter permease [Spirochaetales bacterium]
MNKSRTVLFNAAIIFVIIIGVAAIAAPWISPYNPTDQETEIRFEGPSSAHLLGTDNFGRDVLSRIIHGSRPALIVGLVSVGVAVLIGTAVGLAAGLGNVAADNILMLLMDSILSFPTILLAITVVSFLGYGLVQVMLAIGFIFSPVFARLVRAETLSIKTEGYVEASRALGSGVFKIIIKHILPNLLGKVVVQCSITFAMAVVIEASLSFLGLGTQPPEPSWGLMLKDARNYLYQAPWMAIFPGLTLAFAVLSFNIIGDTLSEKLNPRLLK